MKKRVKGIWRDVYPSYWIISETFERTNFGFATGEAIKLLSIHDELARQKLNRPRENLEVLKRAALILTVTAWESFVESTAERELKKRLELAMRPSDVESIFNFVAQQWLEKQGSNKPRPPDLAQWAGEGWKQMITTSLIDNLRGFNTPNTSNVRDLFKRYIGQDVTVKWSWPGTSANLACSKLDKLIQQRGAIVHKAKSLFPLPSTEPLVRKVTVVDALNLMYNLVDRTEHVLGVAPSCRNPSQ